MFAILKQTNAVRLPLLDFKGPMSILVGHVDEERTSPIPSLYEFLNAESVKFCRVASHGFPCDVTIVPEVKISVCILS